MLKEVLAGQVEKMHQRKRKAEDSPEGRRHKRHPYAMEWGPPPVNYDSPQRMYRGAGHLPPRAVGGSPLSRPSGKVSKSHGSPLGRSDQVCSCFHVPWPSNNTLPASST